MKKLLVFLCAIFLVVGLSGVAGATYLNGVTNEGGWYDATKVGGGDGLFCWAATGANAIAYTGWGAGSTDAQAIFNEYKDYWSSGVGMMKTAVKWWFDDSDISAGGDSYKEIDGGGGYYTTALYNSYFSTVSTTPSSMMTGITSLITQSHSTSTNIGLGLFLFDTSDEHYHHYLNVWGYDVLNDGSYDLYLTNNEAGSGSGLETYNASWSSSRWNLDGGYSSFYIAGLYSLNENDGNDPNRAFGELPPDPDPDPDPDPVPEPATMLLLGTSLLGLAYFSKKKKRA